MKKLTERQKSLRAQGIADGAQILGAIQSKPGFEESYVEWHREYDAGSAVGKFRRRINLLATSQNVELSVAR